MIINPKHPSALSTFPLHHPDLIHRNGQHVLPGSRSPCPEHHQEVVVQLPEGDLGPDPSCLAWRISEDGYLARLATEWPGYGSEGTLVTS